MKKAIGFILFVCSLTLVYGQKKVKEVDLSNNKMISYGVVEVCCDQFDTAYFIPDWDEGLKYKWVAYSDDQKSELRFVHECFGDTCVTTNFYSSGNPMVQETYIADEVFYERKVWYDNHQILYMIHPSKKKDTVVYYYPNGQKKAEYLLSMGVMRTGFYKEWYEDGKLYLTGQYDESGNETGQWNYYNKDGVIYRDEWFGEKIEH